MHTNPLDVRLTHEKLRNMAEFLRARWPRDADTLSLGTARHLVSQMLGFEGWHALASLLDDHGADRRKFWSDDELEEWLPIVETNPHAALMHDHAPVFVTVPSPEAAKEALRDVLALFYSTGEGRSFENIGLISPESESEWPRDFDIGAAYFDARWLASPITGITTLLRLGYKRSVLTLPLDAQYIDFILGASVHTMPVWSFMVARNVEEAMSQLVDSEFFASHGKRDIILMNWQFGQMLPMDAGIRSDWRRKLRKRLQSSEVQGRKRHPLTWVGKDQLGTIMEAAKRVREMNAAAWDGRRRGNAVEYDYSLHNLTLLEAVRAVGPYGIAELRALTLMGMGFDQGMRWQDVLGQAIIGFKHLEEDAAELVARTVDLAQLLAAGLEKVRRQHF